MEQEPDIFDRIAAQASAPLLIDALPKDELPAHTGQAPEAQDISKSPTRTPQAVRKALQYVLANGWLESATKPHMFRLIAAQMAQLDVLCALAEQSMSGVTFQCWVQKGFPVLPMPVMISSAMRSTSYFVQISRIMGQYSFGG